MSEAPTALSLIADPTSDLVEYLFQTGHSPDWLLVRRIGFRASHLFRVDNRDFRVHLTTQFGAVHWAVEPSAVAECGTTLRSRGTVMRADQTIRCRVCTYAWEGWV